MPLFCALIHNLLQQTISQQFRFAFMTKRDGLGTAAPLFPCAVFIKAVADKAL